MCGSIQTVQPIKLKFPTYNAGFLVMHCADFGEYRSNGISTGAKVKNFIHYIQWS